MFVDPLNPDILNVSTITTSCCVNVFDWRKFGALNIRCFVITFFNLIFTLFFCVKIQANESIF